MKGWLVISELDDYQEKQRLEIAEFWPDEEENPEPPYSQDEGILQFHIRLVDQPNGYPKLEVI